MKDRNQPIFLYLILPAYNEEEIMEQNIQILIDYFQELSDKEEIAPESRILFIDDGSSDKTWDIISKSHKMNPIVKGIRLSRNEGMQTALYAGMEEGFKCGAGVVITMDADLQQDIHAMPKFIDEYRKGADIVNGVRSSRNTDSFFKRKTAGLYYGIMRLFGCKIIPNSADYRLLSRNALEALLQYKERDLFIRGLIPVLGFKTAVVEFDVHERPGGSTKFTLPKMAGLAMDGVTSFTIRPIRLILLLGVLILFISGGMMIHILWEYFHENTVSGWASILASIWMLGGLTLFAIGVVGEYVGRAYMESKKRPKYFVEDKLPKEDDEE